MRNKSSKQPEPSAYEKTTVFGNRPTTSGLSKNNIDNTLKSTVPNKQQSTALRSNEEFRILKLTQPTVTSFIRYKMRAKRRFSVDDIRFACARHSHQDNNIPTWYKNWLLMEEEIRQIREEKFVKKQTI